MSYQFNLPPIGDGVEGTVTEFLVKVGDKVSKDQFVILVETDKVTAEIPMDQEGVIEAFLVKIGDKVKDGSPILRMKAGAAEAAPAAAPTPVATPPTTTKVTTTTDTMAATTGKSATYEFRMPPLGDGVIASLTKILVNVGDKVSKDQNIIEIATDKVDQEIPIEINGTVEAILFKVGDQVKDGDLIMRIGTSDAVSAAPASVAAATPAPIAAAPAATQAKSAPVAGQTTAATAPSNGKSYRTSPLARKRAQEFGVNISDVRPADGGGRISYKDVIDYVKTKIAIGGGSTSASAGSGMKQKALPDFSKFGEVERKVQSKVGILTADAMSYSTNTIPHAWISEKADITKVEALRQQYKEQIKTLGGTLTMTTILTKAVAAVLKKMPQFNASLDVNTNEVIFKKYINIGIAVDTPAGLYVPNIKNADKKNLTELSIDLADVSTRTKGGKLTGADLTAGTFTISNIGGIGGTNMLSIVNWPEVAILSIVAANMEPVWNETNKTFEPRLMMPMTIGWDHRVINGGDAARFLQEVKAILEEPFLLNL
jgi:pyruvate dehydrogenase E2 component (dihydrolipoamide acetyltransferase)